MLLRSMLIIFFLLFPQPPINTLFPYTTLFRSHSHRDRRAMRRGQGQRQDRAAALQAQERRHGRDPHQPERLSLQGLADRSEEHTSELQSRPHLVCRLLLEKKNQKKTYVLKHTY